MILRMRHKCSVPHPFRVRCEKGGILPTSTGITLVNISPLSSRTVIIQGGAYGEHRFADVTVSGEKTRINSSTFTVELAPCSGAHLALTTKRYANAPTMNFPWKADTVAAK